MNRNQFYDYLESVHNLDTESAKHLKELVIEYPYFHAARIMLTKNLHDIDDIKYQFELKQTAVNIPDRRQLFLLVHSQSSLKSESKETPIVESKIITSSKVADQNEKSQDLSENYFGVTDEVETSHNTIDFSAPKFNQGKQKDEYFPTDGNLLEYEMVTSNTYRLEDTFVDVTQSRSFTDWLEAMSHAQVIPEQVSDGKEPLKNHQMDLIESFLKKDQGKIVPREEKVIDEVDISRSSVIEKDDLMTETLANIHIKQKHYEKAIEIFEKLILKYPEKNIYFASRIKEIENISNNQ